MREAGPSRARFASPQPTPLESKIAVQFLCSPWGGRRHRKSQASTTADLQRQVPKWDILSETDYTYLCQQDSSTVRKDTHAHRIHRVFIRKWPPSWLDSLLCFATPLHYCTGGVISRLPRFELIRARAGGGNLIACLGASSFITLCVALQRISLALHYCKPLCTLGFLLLTLAACGQAVGFTPPPRTHASAFR